MEGWMLFVMLIGTAAILLLIGYLISRRPPR